MCGIAGVIGAAVAPDFDGKMLGALAHRGPDAEGAWSRSGATLYHRRLSIIDLTAAGNQPFEKCGLTIVFNGEIYNYRELKLELQARGISFDTQSDTEVLLEAWRVWGRAALRKLRGMFAFAIVDQRSGHAWLVRDQFGIKPLFYYPLPTGGLAFSSEMKALEAVYGAAFTLDQVSLSASMLWVYVPEDRCIWKEVRKLPPGGVLEIAPSNQLVIDRYWTSSELLVEPNAKYRTEDEARLALSDALRSSVGAHLVADVPVGAFLSGGIDSSLIVAMAARSVRQMECYTIAFPKGAHGHEGMSADAPFAEAVARHLGVRLSPIEIASDAATLLPEMVAHLDEPIGDSAAINTYLMSRAARDAGAKVLLSGMGADEILGGYRRHKAMLLAEHYRRLPAAMRRSLAATVRRLPSATSSAGLRPVRWAKRFLSFADLPEAEAYQRSYTYYDRDELVSLLGEPAGDAFDMLRRDYVATYGASGGDPLERMCHTDVGDFMVALNLAYTDRASMAASTEVRVPFIDPVVVETAFRIPSALKIHRGVSKHILKKVALDWLPREVVYRSKNSFTMPLRAWVKRDLRDMIEEYILSPSGLVGRPYFNAPALRRLVADERAGRVDNAQRIWHLLTLEQWFRNHRV